MNPLQESVGYALTQACKRHRNKVSAELHKLHIYVGQEMILMQLWEQEGATQSQLAEQICVEPPTVTKMLQRMEQQGFITRLHDEQDARISRVYLTDTGRALQAQVEACWQRVEQQLVQGLSHEERLLLRRLLIHTQHNLV